MEKLAREPKFGPRKRKAFLAMLAEGTSQAGACQQIGISSRLVRYFRKKEPEFDQQVRDAYAEGTDRLEDEIVRRGVYGWDEPVFHKGERVGIVRKYSDAMLTLAIQLRRPEKFRHRADVRAEYVPPKSRVIVDECKASKPEASLAGQAEET